MPEASVYKDDFTPTGKYQVRAARETPHIDSITVSVREEESTQHHFGSGVAASNLRHVVPTPFRRMNVHLTQFIFHLEANHHHPSLGLDYATKDAIEYL